MRKFYLIIKTEDKSDLPISGKVKNQDFTANPLKIKAADSGWYMAEIDSDVFDSAGHVEITIAADSSPAVSAAYLMGEDCAGDCEGNDFTSCLRSKSILYLENNSPVSKLLLSHDSHTVGLSEGESSLGDLLFDGEGPIVEGIELFVEYRKPDSVISSGKDKTTYQDRYGNEISVVTTIVKDRVKYDLSYKVNNHVQQAVPVSISFPLRDQLKQVSYFKKSGKGKKLLHYLPRPTGKHFAPLCQTSFIVARLHNGSCLCFTDNELSNVFFDTSSHYGTVSANMTYWLYPDREGPEQFQWSFEVLPGYGDFCNSMLRAMPDYKRGDSIGGSIGAHFSSHHSIIGSASGRPNLESVREFCSKAVSNGVKAVWYHGWYWRNGFYIKPGVKNDELYNTIWNYDTTLNEVKEIVDEFHKHGIKAMVYFGYGSISRDIMQKLNSCLVRNEMGYAVIGGGDGGGGRMFIENMLGNTRLDGAYAKTLLADMERMLTEFGFDGIALDRSDRFDCCRTAGDQEDFTVGSGEDFSEIFDHGQFDGSVSPVPHYRSSKPINELLPAASITLAGRAFFSELRKLCDRLKKMLISNCPNTPYVCGLSDALLSDQYFDVAYSFFSKAIAGNVPYYIMDRAWDHGLNRFKVDMALGAIYQAYGYVGADQPLLNRHQKLLAVFCSDISGLPEELFFENGRTVLSWHEGAANMIERMDGSYFEYYSPVEGIKRHEWHVDGMHVIRESGDTEIISWL